MTVPPSATPTVIKATLVDIRGDKARIGFAAPITTSIHREEVQDQIDRERPSGPRAE